MLLLKSISQTVLIIAVFFFFLTQQREHLGPKAHWVLLQFPLTLAFLANYGFTALSFPMGGKEDRQTLASWSTHSRRGGGGSLGESHLPPPSPHTHVHSHRLGHQVIFMIRLQYPINLSHCCKIYRLTSSKWSLDLALGPGALGKPRGNGWRGRWEGGLGWGTHVNPWLFHFNVWQNPPQIKINK